MSTLREAAEKALEYMESRECHHESTHRGGVLWTICDDCGRKWADDEGGFVEYREPIPITDLRAALSAAPAPQPAGGEREAFDYWQEAHRLSDALRRHLSAIPAPSQPEAQQERKPLTDEQIDRHSIAAVDCPPSSTVILVSSLRRLLGITATKGDSHE